MTAVMAAAVALAGTLQFGWAADAKESVFFIGAHPDDTEGYAATAFLLRERYDVHVVDLTRGELGLGMAGLKDGSTAKRRMAEEAKACAFLGATPHFLDEVDGFACAGEKSVDRLAGLFKQHKPKAVFTHWPVDEHVDHVQCWAVVANALRKSGLEPERYFFEVLLSQTRNFRPIYRVDVSSTISNKVEMLRCYECQNVNDGLAKEKLAQAALRGREANPPVAAAEVFTTFDGKPIPGGVLAGLPETRTGDGVRPDSVSNSDAAVARGKSVRVACIGDSITYGYAMTNRTAECYPVRLARLLGAGYEVRNFGDPGAGVYTHSKAFGGKGPRSWALRGNLDKALAFGPDIVVSNLGINDVDEYAKEFLPDPKTGRTGVERGRFVREYADLLNRFRAQNKDVRIIIWTRLGPCMKVHRLKGDALPFVMSEDLEKVAKAAGAEGMDMYAPLLPLSETADFCADGIHPEGGACKVIAAETAKQIGR